MDLKPKTETSNQQSISDVPQTFNPIVEAFDQLMKLFPQEHPAGLHAVMWWCQNDVEKAASMIRYVIRYREMYTAQQLKKSECNGQSANVRQESSLDPDNEAFIVKMIRAASPIQELHAPSTSSQGCSVMSEDFKLADVNLFNIIDDGFLKFVDENNSDNK